MATKASSTDKPTPDWERIELDYRAGIKTLRQIAAENGVTHTAVGKRAKQFEWTRDLSQKIQAKADELVSKALVSKLVSKEAKAAERQIVDAGAEAIMRVKLAHRRGIARNRTIVSALSDELELQIGPENAAMLAELGEVMREPDEGGQDKRNDLYRKIISLPERTKTAKTLAETLRITVDLERQAFGMDAKGADTTPGAAGYVPPSVQVHFVRAPQVEVDDD